MRLSIVLCSFLLLPVNGELWINYVLALASDYIRTANYAASIVHLYEVANPVIQRANAYCVAGHASMKQPVYVDGVQTLLTPCGFLSNLQPKLTSPTMYLKQYKIVIKNLADLHFNVSFTDISLLFSLDECMVESLSLIDPDNKRNLKVCGKLTPGDVQLKTSTVGVVFKKHIWSNSSFLLFYHVIDNYARHVHSAFYPIHPFLKRYSRIINILEDYITCHHCYNNIIYIKLMINHAMQLTEKGHDPCCMYFLHDGPTRQYPELIPKVHYGEWVYPTSSGSALTYLSSAKLDYIGCPPKPCTSSWAFTVVNREMETVFLRPKMTYEITFPRNECFRRIHYTYCSIQIASNYSHLFPHVSVRSLYLDQGYNTHTCDHAAVIFTAMPHLVDNRVHSPALLCHKYLTLSDVGWNKRLPFDEYSGGRHIKIFNYIEITYFSYLLPWQLDSNANAQNHITFAASVSTCYGFYLNCHIPQPTVSGNHVVGYGKEDINNLIPILPKYLIEADYLNDPPDYLRKTNDRHYMHLFSDTLDSYRYIANDDTVMTNIHVKRGKMCVTIQKYPRLVPGTQRKCGYTILTDIENMIDYSSRNTVKHHRQKCIKVNSDPKIIILESSGLEENKEIIQAYYESFVVEGQCVFKHTLSMTGYTKGRLRENVAPFIGNYWLQNLHHTFPCKDGFGNGTQILAHYTIPAIITATALTNLERSTLPTIRERTYIVNSYVNSINVIITSN